MKKTIYIALCTMIILGCKDAYANTEAWHKFGTITEEPVSEQAGLTWSFDGNTLTIGGTGAMLDFEKATDAPWYDHLNKITRVIIKQGLRSIGAYAFHDCSRLASITIPNSVTTIGISAFGYCSSLTSITIPNSATTIGWGTFYGCSSLRNVVVLRTTPPSITSGGGFFDTFYQCPLSSATLTVPQGSRSAYQSAKGWNEFGMIVEAGGGGTAEPLTWSLDDGTLTISGTGAMPDFEDFSDIPWYNNRNKITRVNIEKGVTTIGGAAFTDCSSLTSIIIPNSVATIGNYAFAGCHSLTSITIPNSVTTIGNYAFAFCFDLTSITIGNSVKIIGENAFAHCGRLRNVVVLKTTPPAIYSDTFYQPPLSSATLTVPKGSKAAYKNAKGWNEFGTIVEAGSSPTASLTWSLDDGTLTISGTGAMPDFEDPSDSPWYNNRNKITRVNIEKGVTTIGNVAFGDCTSLTSITIPNSVTSIGEGAFWKCTSLTSVTIPNSVTSIGVSAFQDCRSLTPISIPNSVTTIGVQAFYNCTSLTSITIPNSVTSIENYAFSYCSSLTSITIPNSITTIGDYAFYACSSLRDVVVLRTTPPSTASNAFDEVPLSSVTLIVPYGSRLAYQSAKGWNEFGSIVEAPLNTPSNMRTAAKTSKDIPLPTVERGRY